MLPTITLLGRTLPTYGMLAIAGILLGLLLALLRCPRFGLSRDDAAYLFALGGVGALIGAKALYLLTVLPALITDLPLLWQEPTAFLAQYLSGGMVFYGGLLGGILGAWGAARYFKLRFSSFFPVLIPVLPLVHAFGRLGCFCVGCCYGIPADPPLGIAFSQALAAPNGVPLLPVQLWECGAELVIFAFLLWYAGRCPEPRRILGAYILAYAPVRFALEFFRGDAVRGVFGPLSTSQWISLAAVAAVLLGRWYAKRRRQRRACDT